MPLRIDDATFRRDHIGMPDSHAAMFKQVAETLNVMILSRAVGPTCLQLLEQGYDTKGFRVHGKSCDWGPMAGFVLRDPRLNKAGVEKEAFNRAEHHHALHDTTGSGWRASTTPLKIYYHRILWLCRTGRIHIQRVGANTRRDRYEGMVSQAGVCFHYALFKESAHVWGVYIDTLKSAGFQQECDLPAPALLHGRWQPLMAMTNPPTHRSWPEGDFRNAITGDYDLFGVWPREADYRPEADDRRILGTAHVHTNAALIDEREADFVDPTPVRPGSSSIIRTRQATKIGNITNRIYEVCQFLNSAIAYTSSASTGRVYGPFPKRMVCWHSDESARPGVNDVDLPFIAFSPLGVEICVTSIPDFKTFIEMSEDAGYHVSLAEGWTLAATDKKPNRLGAEYARLVPTFRTSEKWNIPRWYNR
jgi:hypothetical protein